MALGVSTNSVETRLDSGIISPDKWGNLPGGEIFTSPYNLNGVFVVDGVVGDYLCEKYGDLQDTPLTIEIANSRIKHLDCANKELLDEFVRYTATDENSNRVGEFAIGTNIAVKNIIGHILQDEKLPGIHLAFGHPYPEHTHQTWDSTTHIDCVGREFDIWMDDEQIMKNGRFQVNSSVSNLVQKKSSTSCQNDRDNRYELPLTPKIPDLC